MGINHPFETPGAEPTVAAVSDAVRLDRIRYELDTVPSFDAFAPVDDLSDRVHDIARIDPDRCRIDSIGRSASGEEIERLTIDGGPRSAIVVGFPHPNEPVGGLTALHLARRLLDVPDLRDRHGLTWHIIACVDPDGARLNETWFSDPGSRDAYNAGFYRPPGRLQVEWTFPFAHGDIRIDAPIPETRALMGLIDEVEPDLLVSLHNSECGGVYSYLSRPEPRLYDVFAAIPGAVGLVLDVGEPEAPWIPLLAPGIFESRPMEEIVDGIIASGGRTDLLAGTSSTDYARRFDTLTLVCEVPQWIDDRACDEQPGTERYDELLATQATRYSQAVTELRSILDAAGDDVVDSPFLVAVVEFLDDMESIAEGSAARSRGFGERSHRDRGRGILRRRGGRRVPGSPRRDARAGAVGHDRVRHRDRRGDRRLRAGREAAHRVAGREHGPLAGTPSTDRSAGGRSVRSDPRRRTSLSRRRLTHPTPP